MIRPANLNVGDMIVFSIPKYKRKLIGRVGRMYHNWIYVQPFPDKKKGLSFVWINDNDAWLMRPPQKSKERSTPAIPRKPSEEEIAHWKSKTGMNVKENKAVMFYAT